MILILSEDSDLSTCEVIDYLIRDGVPYIRINDERLEEFSIDIDANGIGFSFVFDGVRLNLNQFDAFWYRRGGFNIDYHIIDNNIEDIPSSELNKFTRNEVRSTFNAINLALEKIPIRIGAFANNETEKLLQLYVASSCQIDIPRTRVCMDKRSLDNFLEVNGTVASKGIKNNFFYQRVVNKGYCMYTSLISEQNSQEISDRFLPTLFQEYQNKKYELRIFYLHGDFYSMAIFSQNNPQTRIDFRRYDWTNPNRVTPFKLPSEMEIKLQRLMQKLEMDTGSIDMVVTNEDRYVFLEVNPVGQFGMVSHPCNYFIERKIASHLSISSQ